MLNLASHEALSYKTRDSGMRDASPAGCYQYCTRYLVVKGAAKIRPTHLITITFILCRLWNAILSLQHWHLLICPDSFSLIFSVMRRQDMRPCVSHTRGSELRIQPELRPASSAFQTTTHPPGDAWWPWHDARRGTFTLGRQSKLSIWKYSSTRW
jgi:hypothetical protein